MREIRGHCNTQMKVGAGKDGTTRIEGVEDEERTALEKVGSMEHDPGDEQDAEEEEELGRSTAIRKHDLRQPSEQERIEHEMLLLRW